MAAGKKLRDWSLRCPDTAGHVFNTQHQDMWKIIIELDEAVRLNRAATIRLSNLGRDAELAKYIPAFGTGWSFVTCTVFKAVKQWTAFFTNNIFDDLQIVGPPRQIKPPRGTRARHSILLAAAEEGEERAPHARHGAIGIQSPVASLPSMAASQDQVEGIAGNLRLLRH